MEDIQVKLLTSTAVVPQKGRDGDAAFDLYTNKDVTLYYKTLTTVSTGVAIKIPEGYFGYITGRSGMTFKDNIITHQGVIDNNYVGELGVCLENCNKDQYPKKIVAGDRVAQLLILPVPNMQMAVVDELEDTVRGDAGFGSSGR